MKKLTSKEPISFRVNGQTLLEITPKGCICSDEDAKIVTHPYRLGSSIQVHDISPEEAKKEAEALLKSAEKSEKEAEAQALKDKTEKEAKEKSEALKAKVEADKKVKADAEKEAKKKEAEAKKNKK